MLVLRLTLWLKIRVGIGKPPLAKFVLVAETLPKSAYRYSAFTVHRLHTAASTPPPTVQPALVADAEALSVAGAKGERPLELKQIPKLLPLSWREHLRLLG